MSKQMLLVILGFILTISCCPSEREIYYQYGDITVKRIDYCDKTEFFYFKNGEKQKERKILCKYSGLDDGFSGFLIFSNQGNVEIIVSDGYFESKSSDSKFTFKYYDVVDEKKINKDLGVYEVLLSTRYEKERNEKRNSGVKTIYKE